jgi:uncharacterized protein
MTEQVPRRPALAAMLDLEPHPEGGWFRETWRTDMSFEPSGYSATRAVATAIYYALAPGEESAWHQVRSDELWLHHAGSPLVLRIGDTGNEPGEHFEIILGPDLGAGQVPQALVPGGCWQSAQPLEDREVLLSCVVAPGFDFADWRGPEFLNQKDTQHTRPAT